MDRLTILYPIFNPTDELIKEHVDNWASYNSYIRKKIKIILVDDCSRVPVKFDCPLDITIARITTDRGYNVGGAKNLGFHIADNGWVLQSDIDHFILPCTIESILAMNPDPLCVYRFKRIRVLKTGSKERVPPHSNSYLITRDLFWKLGGFDEDFAGNYGSEDSLMRWVMDQNNIPQHVLDCHLLEKECHQSEMSRARKRPNRNLKNEKMKDKNYKNGPTLRFEWIS